MALLAVVVAGALFQAGLVQAAESEQLAAPKLKSISNLPPVPTLPAYLCIGLPETWTQDQQDWCCKHEDVNCPTTTTRETTSKVVTTTHKASAPKVWSWTHEENEKFNAQSSPGAGTSATPVATTAGTTTMAGPPTTTSHTCDEVCTVNGLTATCRDQIQQASLSDFLGLAESCALAQQATADHCSVCAGCPPIAVGCGVMELATTAGPTTTIPLGDPCNAVCTLGEQPATCNARIRWSVDHVFVDKPHACKQAVEMVLDQCSVCSLCKVEDSECAKAGPLVAIDERLFDCSKGATVEWSEAKQVWCCEHHQKACDLMKKKQVFFQRKVSEPGAVAGQVSRPGPLLTLTLISLAVLGTAAVATYRATQRRRQHGSALQCLVENEVFSE